MIDLTKRQTEILQAIIKEYIETAEPVGSETLEKKYEIGVSPATIRNEMAQLAQAGLLEKPHPSAGRVPTPMSLKFYISQLMDEQELSVAEEVGVKERIWDYRNQKMRLLREAAKILADKTNLLSIVTTSEGTIYHSGYANILSSPEFFDIDVTREVLQLIDDIERMNQLFEKTYSEESVHILLGDELETPFLKPCGVVFTKFQSRRGVQGNVGIIGPCRIDYSQTIPQIKYIGKLIEEIIRDW
jgi:heat-inducible transcriptional repressor